MIPEKVGVAIADARGGASRFADDADLVDPIVGSEVEDDAVEDIEAGLGLVVGLHRPIGDDIAVYHVFRPGEYLL